MISGAVKGAVSGAVEPVANVLIAKEETKRAIQQQLAWAKVAAAAWRPALATAIKWMVFAYVACSFFLSLIVLIGFAFGAGWATFDQGKSDLAYLFDFWKWLGGRIFWFSGLFLTTYAGSRGLEKVADSVGGKAGGVIGTVARAVTGNKKEPVREELEARETIEKIPGVKAPEPKPRLKPKVNANEIRHNKGYKASKRTLANLSTVDDELARVPIRAMSISKYDFVVIQGQRTFAEQKANYDNGDSETLRSRHVEDPSQAFDIMAIDENGKATWGDGTKNDPYYSEIARAMRLAAADFEIEITCGIDWGWDAGHFERSRSEVAFQWPDGVDLSLV